MGGASNEHRGQCRVNAELNMAAMLHRDSCNGRKGYKIVGREGNGGEG